MNPHPLTMAFRDHDYRVVEYRPNLFDELAAENAQRASIEHYEKLARQARRKTTLKHLAAIIVSIALVYGMIVAALVVS